MVKTYREVDDLNKGGRKFDETVIARKFKLELFGILCILEGELFDLTSTKCIKGVLIRHATVSMNSPQVDLAAGLF